MKGDSVAEWSEHQSRSPEVLSLSPALATSLTNIFNMFYYFSVHVVPSSTPQPQ